jgi:LDH2 family malate/lactate/ureidoglycolate dehydrogenase
MPDDLFEFYVACFEGLGLPGPNARAVASGLLDADLTGTDTHGIHRLSIYADRIRKGGIVVDAEVEVVSDNGSTVLLDGNHGPGQVAATRAMQLAVERAKEHGIAAVGVRRSNHLGTLAYYSKMALPHGEIGFAVTGVASSLAPWGAAQAMLGSNPWSWAIPAKRHPPIVVDQANGVVTSTVTRNPDSGEAIPPGVAIDSEGRPALTKQAALGGSLLPIGGHKGYGLTLIFEVLASVLPGAAYSYQIAKFEEPGRPKSIGHFMLAIDVERFDSIESFTDRVDDLLDHVLGAHHGPDQPGARIPGHHSHATEVERRTNGVPISAGNLERAQAVASSVGVAPLRVREGSAS